MVRTTAVGPNAQLPVLTASAVAVGMEKIGPTPQMTEPDWAGVKKICSWMSPNPPDRLSGPAGRFTYGTIVRAMMVHFFSTPLMGTTGWKLRLKNVRSSNPPPLLKLNWNGRLTRSATGFWVALASRVASSSVGCCEATGTAWMHSRSTPRSAGHR